MTEHSFLADAVHWRRLANGDLAPRAQPLPVAGTACVLEGVAHLETEGTLHLPSAERVERGYRYGVDRAWTGTLDPVSPVPPAPDVADGWGRLRALVRARLDGLRGLTGEARGVVARGHAMPRVWPSAEFDLSVEAGSRPEAGFFEVRLRLAFYAGESAALDGLAQGAVGLLAGWSLVDGVWSARGFVLVSQGDGEEGEGVCREQVFLFRAWRASASEAAVEV